MGENEGKDLAQDMKKEELEIKKYYENVNLELSKIRLQNVLIEEINKRKINENNETIETIEYGVYIKFKGENVKIATINEGGVLIPNRNILNNEDKKYTDEELEALGDMLNRLGLENEKVDINKLQEQLREIEAKTKEELDKEVEKDEEETNKDDLENEKDENEEEPEVDEQEIEDKEKEEIALLYGLKASQIVHINTTDEKITENHSFPELVKWAQGKKDIYVIPGKDPYTWKVIGRENEKEEFKEIEEANRQIYGKNPDITIKRIDGEKITEVKPIAVHDIDGDSVMAVVKDAYGQPEVLYCRKEDGEQKYWGSVVPEVSGKNVRQMEYDERAFMSSKYNSGMDLDRKATELEKAQNLDARGVPSKEEGVQVYEIDGNSRQNYEMRKEEIVEDLMKRDGIIDKLTVPPGYYEHKAEKVLKLLHEDEEIIYEDAVEKVDEAEEREEGGRTPGENERRNR